MNKLLELAIEAINEKKGIKPLLLDLRGVSGVTDYFLICSGQSPVQVRTIADNIQEKIQPEVSRLPFKEGYHDGVWILLDFGEFVVHVLRQDEREFYSLENLWHDAKVTPIE